MTTVRTRVQAALRTMATFAVVALAWMAAATALPNFHVADATPAGRLFFVGVVLLLLAGILAAQLAMLRTWFGARLAARPDRARAIAAERRATLVVIAICVGVGISVLWYATREWMPHVQRAVRGPGEPAAADDARAPGGGPP